MFRKIAIVACICLSSLLVGCRGNLSPFTGQQRQQLKNQNGRIGELENLNNALKVDLDAVKSQAEVHARDIQAMQQGFGNRANSGVQILQGDGILIVILVLGAMGMCLAFYYKSKATKSEKVAQILAQQISTLDEEAKNNIYLAALNSPVQSEIYQLLKK